MALKDFIFFPLIVMLSFFALYIWQKNTGYSGTRWRYALAFKFFASLFIGLIYNFYYQGGDTFNFYHHSEQIWSAIIEQPYYGVRLLFTHGVYYPELGEFISKMWWYNDGSSMAIARVSAFIGLFCYHSYLGITAVFSVLSFSASFAIYRVFSNIRPEIEKYIFIVAFFIPSAAAWGSGLFKDTISAAAVSWLVYAFYFGIIKRQRIVLNTLLILIMSFLLSTVKIYILISVLPALFAWFILVNLSKIESKFLRAIVAPLILIVMLAAGYSIINQITSENERYALENISNTAKITAMDIYAGWGAGSGSAYFLGEQDGSIGNFIQLMPSALIVTLFRPWPWEISNGIMVLSAFESLFFLIVTLFVILKVGFLESLRIILSKPAILFCIIFSLILAVGVGIASYNFGTLSRYKIPLLPYYLMALLFIFSEWRLGTKKTMK